MQSESEMESGVEFVEVETPKHHSPKNSMRRSPVPIADPLLKKAETSANQLLEITRKPGMLRGTCVRDIRQAAENLLSVTKEMSTRPASDEVRRLQADNNRLQREVEAMRGEIQALRKAFSEKGSKEKAQNREAYEDVQSLETQTAAVTREEFLTAMEALQSDMLSQVGAVISARMEGLDIDGRLLPCQSHRPPLSGDRSSKPKQPTLAMCTEQPQELQAPTTLLPPANLPKKAREVSRKAISSPTSRQTNIALISTTSSAPILTSSAATQGEWTRVEKKKRSKRAKESVNAVGTQAVLKKKKTPKAPKSLAVVLALEPTAVEKGVTYEQAITKAKQSVNLSQLGIGPSKFRTGVTGARIIELPKDTTATQADTLAAKIKEALGDMVKVTRPVKTVDIKITGIDDSASTEEIVQALARTGECPTAQIKMGKIHVGARGAKAVYASVPVEAGKRLDKSKRLEVGWSSACIELLEQRPMRCYRCMGVGHPVQRCPSIVDRSNLCYRCGSVGHSATDCTAEAKCAVCAASKRPANHRMGGAKCNPPPVKGRNTALKVAEIPRGTPPPSSSVAAMEEQIETTNVQ